MLFWLSASGGVAVLFLHIASLYPFMADDAFISLRYSRRLLDGEGLTWDDFERVEGYSNLTWVLLCALLGALGVDLVFAARLLGVLSSLGVLAALLATFRPKLSGFLPAQAAIWGLAACSPFAAWSIGGLEQPLVAALVAWLVAILGYPERFDGVSPWLSRVLVALLVFSRPDGVLVCALLSLSLLFAPGQRLEQLKHASTIFAWALLAFIGQLVFRLTYYGDWVPNPARIKLALSLDRLQLGWVYVSDAIALLSPQILPIVWVGVLILARTLQRRAAAIVTIVSLGWACYVCFIGGDIFPARRHVVLLIVLGAFAVGELVAVLVAARGTRLSLGLVVGYVGVLGIAQARDFQADVARAERWEWDGEVIGRLLKTAFADRAPLLAVDPAGCLPFFSELPSIDMLGLNDRHIARNPPRDLGKGKLAHEFGDGKYVLSRDPDLVLFCLPHGSDRACFRSAAEMLSDPTFSQGYRLLHFQGDVPYTFRSRIWVKMESARIGVQRKADRITVPGYLFAEDSNTVARLGDSGHLVASVNPSTTARLRGLAVPAGTYRLEVTAQGEVVLGASKGFTRRTPRSGEVTFSQDTVFDVTITAKSPVQIEKMVLKRSDAT